jgi:pSer/pThr/pTyr-binding forkhead associated (FHA) protein
MDAKLRVIGPITEQTMQMPRGKLLIGRAEDCDFRPNSEVISGYHCVLLLDDYTLRIRDLASKNGTRVNGRLIGTGSTILSHNDLVSIGEINLIVDLIQATDGPGPVDSEARSSASPTATEKTGVIDGDTLQAQVPGVIPLADLPKLASMPSVENSCPPFPGEKP